MVYTYAQKARKILRIAIPSGANSLLDIIVLACGMLFMGRLGGEYLVALSIGMQFMMLFFAINAIFYIGTSAQISRLYGKRDANAARLVFGTIITTSLLSALPIIGLAYMGIGAFITWMDISEEASTLAEVFLLIVMWSLPIMVLKNIIIAAFASIGDTLSIFIARLFMTGFCLLAHVVLIFGMGLGIIGAGVASLITSVLELLVFVYLVWRRGEFFACWRGVLRWEYARTMLIIGIPAGIDRLLTLGSLVLTTRLISDFGDFAVAGSQIGARIESFAFMPGFGFMVAAMALTGQSLGASRIEVAKDLHTCILQISSVVMGILGVLMAVFAKPLSAMFYHDESVIEVAVWYLLAVGFSQVPLIVVFVLDGVLRGAGQTTWSMCINIGSVWCLRIMPMWLGIHAGMPLWWVFVMIFLETYARALLFYLAYKKGAWLKG